MCQGRSHIFGSEIIVDLLARNSLRDVLRMFINEQIDFKFGQRFDNSFKILKEKESITDVKVCEYLLDNIKKLKLFTTQNHPTSPVLIYVAKHVLKLLGINTLPQYDYSKNDEASLGDCWPDSPYELKFYDYQYKLKWQELFSKKRDSNWARFGVRLIGDIARREYGRLETKDELYLAYLYRKVSLQTGKFTVY